MNILVLGSGAREHAIILALQNDEVQHHIICAPGNAGIAQIAETISLDPNNPGLVTQFAVAEQIDLVVVGPEAPLVAGVSDALRAAGIAVFGPSKAAAQIEGSKTFAKRVMDAAGVPTGRSQTVASVAEAEVLLDVFGAPYVVKADGLAAGKGVLVTEDRAAALQHVSDWVSRGSVLIEEFLAGEELSLFVVSDGERVLPLSPAQDFKRLADGDAGPNTGGMGSFSPVPWCDQSMVDAVVQGVALPTVRQLAAQGTPFVGLLYCGLIATPQGLRVIEFNARFGDPETQGVLPRLRSPFAEVLFAAATGQLDRVDAPRFADEVSVTVVLASENYPESPVTGRVISGLAEAAAVPGVHIAHAATMLDASGQFVATGGRVLSVVAQAPTFGAARERAYEAMSHISLAGGQFRTDIAAAVAAAE